MQVSIDTIVDTRESQEIVHETRLDNDPVLYFVENYIPLMESTRLPVKFLFNAFLAVMAAENNPQKMKQNTFTKQVKPLMEEQGWRYDRKNLKPGDWFSLKDAEIISEADKGTGTAYGYLAMVETEKKQPLFEKATS